MDPGERQPDQNGPNGYLRKRPMVLHHRLESVPVDEYLACSSLRSLIFLSIIIDKCSIGIAYWYMLASIQPDQIFVYGHAIRVVCDGLVTPPRSPAGNDPFGLRAGIEH